MNIEEALSVLKENEVTDSVQMLRRWIRQDKIKATMESKRTGYVVDVDSLNTFISEKKGGINGSRKEISVVPISNLKTYEESLNDRYKVRLYDLLYQ